MVFFATAGLDVAAFFAAAFTFFLAGAAFFIDFLAGTIFFTGFFDLATAADLAADLAGFADFCGLRAGFAAIGFFAGLAFPDFAFFFAAGAALRFEFAIFLTIVPRRSRVIA